jgi:hypothetical protein
MAEVARATLRVRFGGDDPRIASTPADEHKTANEHDASTVEATASRE